MTTPTSGNYWSADVAQLDEEKKKYRSIPVPAVLAKEQKNIDKKVQLELLTDFLATRNDFTEPFPHLAHLSLEDQVSELQGYVDRVRAAPDEQQQDAQRSLGGHLEDFGATIGRGLLKGIGTVVGAPGISHALSALSAPGEEAAAQIIHNIARVIPGEQDVERGIREWKQENPNAPWWKKATLTSAVREKGFGVPMGVHLPLEIIFDPLNLIPFGAAFKLYKPAKIMIRLMGEGNTAAESARLIGKANRIRKIQIKQAKAELEELQSNEDAFAAKLAELLDDEDNIEFLNVNTPPFPGAGPGAMRGHGVDAADDEVYDHLNKGIDKAEATTTVEKSFADAGEALNSPGGVGNYDQLHGVPDIIGRGEPIRGVESAEGGVPSYGLAAIINDIGPEGLSEEAGWALRAMFHLGIRPHEIMMLRWEDLKATVTGAREGQDSFVHLINSTGHASDRLIDEEALNFLRKFVEYRGESTPDALRSLNLPEDKLELAFRMPGGVGGDEAVKVLNDEFRRVASKPEHNPTVWDAGDNANYGNKILEFYEKNAVYSYVFRLSKANSFYIKEGRGARGLLRTMKMMGHNSPIHTARYISLNHHNQAGMIELLEEMGMVTRKDFQNVEEALNASDAAWKVGLDEETIAKVGSVKVLAEKRVGTTSRKGYTDDVALIVNHAIRDARIDLINKAIDPDQAGDALESVGWILPRNIWKRTLPDGSIQDDYEALVRAINSLQGLQHLTQFLTMSISEKNLIKRSKEVADKSQQPDKAMKEAIAKMQKSASENAAVMSEWFDPILEVAHNSFSVIDNIFAGTADDVIEYSAKNTPHLQALKIAFDILGHAEIQKLEFKKGGSRFGGGTAKLPKLSDLPIFSKILLRAPIKGKQPAKDSNKAKEIAAAKKEWAEMTPEARKASMEAATGYVIRQTKKTSRPGLPDVELKSRGGSNLWVITDWVRTKGGGPNSANRITHAVVEKLATTHYDPATEQIVMAAKKSAQTMKVPLDDFQNWVQHYDLPFQPHMIRAATTGGHARLTAKEIAHALFQWGGDPNVNRNKRRIDRDLNLGDIHWSTQRLVDNGHMRKVGGTEAAPTYQFSDEVIREFEEIGTGQGILDPEYAWGRIAKEGGFEGPPGGTRQPPTAAGAPTPEPDLPPGMNPDNKIKYVDQNNVEHPFSDRFTQPRGMRQVMSFAGGEAMYRLFNKIPADMQKYMRMLVPGSFAASPGAMLRWMYAFSKSEGRNVASDIGHMMDEIHKITGHNRRDGIGRRIGIADDMDAIDPKTGMFKNPEILRRDYMRHRGAEYDVMITAELKEFLTAGLRNVPEARRLSDEMAKLLDMEVGKTTKLRLGPLAVMEETFKKFVKENPQKWGDDYATSKVVIRERKRYNHKYALQDLSAFLGTHRDDLDMFYKMEPELQRMYDWYHQIGPMLVNVLEHAGFDVTSDASILGKPRGQFRHAFVPFLMTEEFAKGMAPRGVKSLGQKPTQFMTHEHYWQIEGKLAQGNVMGRIKHEIYNTDPVLALQRQAESYYDYISSQKFMDEYAKLGLQEDELTTAPDIGNKILASRKEGGSWNHRESHLAARFFGAGWQSLSDSDIQQRLYDFQEMSAGWQNQIIKNASEHAPPDHALATTALPPNASRELVALISDEIHDTSKFLTVPSTIANMLRVLATGADLGVMLLHGFGGLGMTISPNPTMPWKQRFAWSRASINMGRALLDPSVRTEWYKSTMNTRAEMQKYGVAFFRSTHVEDLPLPGYFTKGQYKPSLEKPVLKNVAQAGQAAWQAVPERMINGFGFFLDVSKTEMWKAQSFAIRKEAGLIDEMGAPLNATRAAMAKADQAFNDLSASLNAIHGTLEPATVGIPQKQRVFESAFLLYAALYRRSAVALLKNMTSGVTGAGRGGWEARKWRRGPALEAASGMMMAGAAIGYAAWSTGNNDNAFDPGSADFMSAKFGNMRVGLGTPYYTFMRMGRDVFDQVKEGDIEGLGEVNFSDNSLLRYARSMGSPVSSIIIDIGTGATFTGDPLRDTTGGWEVNKIGTRVTKNLMPFWLDSMLFDPDIGTRGALAEFFGLRTSPQSPYGRFKIAKDVAILVDQDPKLVSWKEAQLKAGLAVNGDTIPKLLLRDLIERHPDLVALQDEISLDVQRRGSALRKDQDTYIQTVNKNREDLEVKLLDISNKFEAGLLSPRDFIKAKNNAEKQHMGMNKQLSESNAEVIATFEERRTGRMNNPIDIFVFDLEYDRYRAEVTGSPDLYDDAGNFDVEQFKTKEQDFKKKLQDRYGANLWKHAWKYVQSLREQGKSAPGAVGRLQIAQKTLLKNYWELHVKIWGQGHPKVILVNNWRSLISQQEKDYFESKNFRINFVLKQLKRHQDKYRRAHPAVDAALVEFYGYKALTSAGKAIERRRAAQARSNYPTITDRTYQGGTGGATELPTDQAWPVEMEAIPATPAVMQTETDPTKPPLQTTPVMR